MSTENRSPKKRRVNNEIAWVDVNKLEHGYVMQLAKEHNLDHLIHPLPNENGYWLKFKEDTLTKFLYHLKANNVFIQRIKDRM